jgi:hypothetical protein
LAESHVLVVVVEGGGAGPASMTGKIYEYLALRRPILVLGPEGVASRLVTDSGAGVAANPTDRSQLGQAIATVINMARDADFAGAPTEVLQRFDRRLLAAEWARLLKRVYEDQRFTDGHRPP